MKRGCASTLCPRPEVPDRAPALGGGLPSAGTSRRSDTRCRLVRWPEKTGLGALRDVPCFFQVGQCREGWSEPRPRPPGMSAPLVRALVSGEGPAWAHHPDPGWPGSSVGPRCPQSEDKVPDARPRALSLGQQRRLLNSATEHTYEGCGSSRSSRSMEARVGAGDTTAPLTPWGPRPCLHGPPLFLHPCRLTTLGKIGCHVCFQRNTKTSHVCFWNLEQDMRNGTWHPG